MYYILTGVTAYVILTILVILGFNKLDKKIETVGKLGIDENSQLIQEFSYIRNLLHNASKRQQVLKSNSEKTITRLDKIIRILRDIK